MKKIITGLQKTVSLYQHLLSYGEKQQALLLEDRFSDIEKIQQEETAMLMELEKNTTNLKETIDSYCKEKGIEEPRIRHLVSWMTKEEKEAIESLQTKVMELERTWRGSVLRNRQVIASKMAFPEIVRRAMVHQANESGEEGPSMFSKRY